MANPTALEARELASLIRVTFDRQEDAVCGECGHKTETVSQSIRAAMTESGFDVDKHQAWGYLIQILLAQPAAAGDWVNDQLGK